MAGFFGGVGEVLHALYKFCSLFFCPYDIFCGGIVTAVGHRGFLGCRGDAFGNVDGHFEVTSFDRVNDGSDFTPSAKRIFGDKFDEFSRINSNDVARDSARMEAIRKYVDRNGLKVNLVQDYGWPAKEIK